MCIQYRFGISDDELDEIYQDQELSSEFDTAFNYATNSLKSKLVLFRENVINRNAVLSKLDFDNELLLDMVEWKVKNDLFYAGISLVIKNAKMDVKQNMINLLHASFIIIDIRHDEINDIYHEYVAKYSDLSEDEKKEFFDMFSSCLD